MPYQSLLSIFSKPKINTWLRSRATNVQMLNSKTSEQPIICYLFMINICTQLDRFFLHLKAAGKVNFIEKHWSLVQFKSDSEQHKRQTQQNKFYFYFILDIFCCCLLHTKNCLLHCRPQDDNNKFCENKSKYDKSMTESINHWS